MIRSGGPRSFSDESAVAHFPRSNQREQLHAAVRKSDTLKAGMVAVDVVDEKARSAQPGETGAWDTVT
jgi:hypothetical protein